MTIYETCHREILASCSTAKQFGIIGWCFLWLLNAFGEDKLCVNVTWEENHKPQT